MWGQNYLECVPAVEQLMTNSDFANADGSSGDPLLNLGHVGYALFWGIGLCLIVLAFFGFRWGSKMMHEGQALGYTERVARRRLMGSVSARFSPR